MNNHHEKWISTVIWVALLIGLVFTSYYAWQTTATNSILNISASIWQDNKSDNDIKLVEWINLMLYGVVATLVFLSWFRFADMSLDILKAYAKGESPFPRMLVYPLDYAEDTDEEKLDIDQAENSVITGLLRNLGFLWLMIILLPPVMSILTKLLD